MNIDPNLHQIQGVNHLNRALSYAPMVAVDGRAEVFLTAEDWHVVADTMFHMETPREMLPESILEFERKDQAIELTTKELIISLEMI